MFMKIVGFIAWLALAFLCWQYLHWPYYLNIVAAVCCFIMAIEAIR